MDPRLSELAQRAKGFMPHREGLALYRAALEAPPAPWLEIGSYCGKSALYLGAAARERGTVLYSLDHHRGSEEHQPGEAYHDPDLVDRAGRVDTLLEFRKTIAEASLEDAVVAVVGESARVARAWGTRLGLVFIDGGHSEAAARADYEGWAPHLVRDGLLLIHDVFPDPAAGGQAPYRIYDRALASGAFREVGATNSLRVLRRVADGF